MLGEKILEDGIMSDLDCGELLAQFIEGAPATLRDWLAVRVHFIVLDDSFETDKDHLSDLLHSLRASDDLERPFLVIKIAAAIDHALIPFGPNQKEFFQQAIQRMKGSSQRFQDNLNLKLAQADLRERHLKQTREEWAKLRSTSLSPEAVREFENRLHTPSRNRS